MKVEQIIDEMQASLTKLRGHFRKAGTATEDIARQVPLHYCICPNEIPCPVHDKNYQELKENLTGTAGDGVVWLSNKKTFEYCRDPQKCCKHNPNTPNFSGKALHSTLDLPLNVRVAKALGEEVTWDEGWYREFEDKVTCDGGFERIPDYPNDLVAARDAFDLYFEQQCRKIDDHFDYSTERIYRDGWKWRVRFGFADESVIADSLEEGFCEAIVAHAEQR